MNLSVDHNRKFIPAILWALTVWAVAGQTAGLRVDLNPPERRTDILTPHWENWAWHEGNSDSQTFGGVTVTFRAAPPAVLTPVLFKGLLDYGAHMACDGIVVGKSTGDDGFDMTISGLTSGKHTIVTYHNEVRDLAPATFDVWMGETLKIKGFTPTTRATNDYEVASTFLEIDAVAGKEVMLRFRPEKSGASRSLILNGFAIDAPDPHKMAIEPSPANDDEHWPNEQPLTWRSAPDAVAHQFYFGTDSNSVAIATVTSPEFKGKLPRPSYSSLPKLDALRNYFWRVDEADAAGHVTRGEVWRFRVRHPAFPTAEGYGRFAIGGRGGRVLEVTNLQDYDARKGEAVIPGSFRAAVEAEARRRSPSPRPGSPARARPGDEPRSLSGDTA